MTTRIDHGAEALRIIDATLNDYHPIANADIIEEQEHEALHQLVAEGWCEVSEEELIWAWFERKRLT